MSKVYEGIKHTQTNLKKNTYEVVNNVIAENMYYIYLRYGKFAIKPESVKFQNASIDNLFLWLVFIFK